MQTSRLIIFFLISTLICMMGFTDAQAQSISPKLPLIAPQDKAAKPKPKASVPAKVNPSRRPAPIEQQVPSIPAVDESRLEPLAEGRAKVVDGAIFPWLTSAELVALSALPALLGTVLVFLALRRRRSRRPYAIVEV